MKARKVIVTGPESTGKTVLCEYLAEFFKGVCVPEYARFYVEQLSRPYTKRDVIKIGKRQNDQLNQEFPGQEKGRQTTSQDTVGELLVAKLGEVLRHHGRQPDVSFPS